MLSRQTSVKLEMNMMSSLSNVSASQSKLDTLKDLFDPNRLNEESDELEEENEEDATLLSDFKLLLSNKTGTFDVEHFEFLLNDYSKKTSLKLTLDKVFYIFSSFFLR